jgi:hypothetical protein
MRLTKGTWVDALLLFAVAIFLVFIFAEQPRIYPRTQTQLNLSLASLPLYALHSLLRMKRPRFERVREVWGADLSRPGHRGDVSPSELQRQYPYGPCNRSLDGDRGDRSESLSPAPRL